MKPKLDVDATKLSEALKYQVHVAIDYCHTLNDDESLWIEIFGDVTVAGRDQIEVKLYADSLTDGHINFWNTVNNWLKPEFDHRRYVNLVLLTTQGFGQNALLKDWNDQASADRLKLLEEIHATSEARSAKEPAEGAEVKKPSKALKMQRRVLSAELRESLGQVLPKIRIATDQPDLADLIERYRKQHLRPILPHRCHDYLDDLFGFMTNAARMSNGWQITGAEFTKKIVELTTRYKVGNCKFPQVDHEALERRANEADVRKRRFAIKLDEIGGPTYVPAATADLLHAEHYISELLKDCTISSADLDAYRRGHLKSHRLSRLGAIESCSATVLHEALQRQSRIFYLNRCAANVEQFCGYENTPPEFRNGIYQMLADELDGDPEKGLHWRLWE